MSENRPLPATWHIRLRSNLLLNGLSNRPKSTDSNALILRIDQLYIQRASYYPNGNQSLTVALPFGRQSPYILAMAKRRSHEGSGPSQRQLRVGELVRRALSDILMQGDVHDPDLNRMSITVGEVRCSPDLKVATAWVMPLGGGERDEAIEALARNRAELRRLLGRETELKFTPDLRFRIDETFDRMDETRALFADDHVRQDLEE